MQSEQIKQVALLFAQSTLKKEATAVFNCACCAQKSEFLQTGQLSWLPFTSTVWGSVLFLLDSIPMVFSGIILS